MKKILRKILSAILGIFPANTIRFFYKTILKPAPIRFVVNTILTVLIPKALSIKEGALLLNRHDPVVSGALMLGIFEPLQTKLTREILQPGMNFVDIGANIGYYTMIAASRIGPQGKVLAFEPQSESFSLLEKMVQNNNFKNVACYKLALSDHSDSAKLFLSKNHFGNQQIFDSGENRDSEEIQIAPLDKIVSALKINIDIIKMDVEGAEGMALAGMEETLSQNQNIKLITEFYPALLKGAKTDPKLFLEKLKSLGFSISEIDEQNRIMEPVRDFEVLIKKLENDQFTNLYCYRE